MKLSLLITILLVEHSYAAVSPRCRVNTCSTCVSKGCFFSTKGVCSDECTDLENECYGKYPGIPPPYNFRGCPGSGECRGYSTCDPCVNAMCFFSVTLSGNVCSAECLAGAAACFTKNTINSLQNLCPTLPPIASPAPTKVPTPKPAVTETLTIWIAPHLCANQTCFAISSQPLGVAWEDYEGYVVGVDTLSIHSSMIYQVEAQQVLPFSSQPYLTILRVLDVLPQNPRLIRSLWISGHYVSCSGLFPKPETLQSTAARKPVAEKHSPLSILWSLKNLVLVSPIAQKFKADHEYFLGLLKGGLFNEEEPRLYKLTTALAILETVALQSGTVLTSLQLSVIGFEQLMSPTEDTIRLPSTCPFVITVSLLIQELVPANLFQDIELWTYQEFEMLKSVIWLVWEARHPAPPGLCLEYRFSPNGPLHIFQGRIRGFDFMPGPVPQYINVRESIDGNPLWTFLHYCTRQCSGPSCIFEPHASQCGTVSPTNNPTESPTSMSPSTAFPTSSPTTLPQLIWKQSGFPPCGLCGTSISVYQTVFCYNTVIKLYVHDRFCANIIPRPSQVKSCNDNCTFGIFANSQPVEALAPTFVDLPTAAPTEQASDVQILKPPKFSVPAPTTVYPSQIPVTIASVSSSLVRPSDVSVPAPAIQRPAALSFPVKPVQPLATVAASVPQPPAELFRPALLPTPKMPLGVPQTREFSSLAGAQRLEFASEQTVPQIISESPLVWFESGVPTCPTFCGQRPATLRKRVFCVNTTARMYIRGKHCASIKPRPSGKLICGFPDCSNVNLEEESAPSSCVRPEAPVNCGGCAELVCGTVRSCGTSCLEGCRCDARLSLVQNTGCVEVCEHAQDYDYDVFG